MHFMQIVVVTGTLDCSKYNFICIFCMLHPIRLKYATQIAYKNSLTDQALSENCRMRVIGYLGEGG